MSSQAARSDDALTDSAALRSRPRNRVVIDWLYVTGMRQAAEAVGFPLRMSDDGGDLLIFVDDGIETPTFQPEKQGRLVTLGVSEREMINIGAGVPEGWRRHLPLLRGVVDKAKVGL